MQKFLFENHFEPLKIKTSKDQSPTKTRQTRPCIFKMQNYFASNYLKKLQEIILLKNFR